MQLTKSFSSILQYFTDKIIQEYHNIDLWYFVSFIVGIIYYFSRSCEITVQSLVLIFTTGLILLVSARADRLNWRILSCLILSFGLGVGVSKYRESSLSTITINNSLISQIEGLVTSIRPNNSGRQVIISDVTIAKSNIKLKKIRINISDKYSSKLNLNDHVRVKARLHRPRSGNILGGYDFAFYSYFEGIGATGYAMSEPKILSSIAAKDQKIITKIRKAIYDRLITTMSKTEGNFAAAILLGETSGIDKELMRNMRQSGISHILCVSGLHLSLVAMILFVSLRFILNLSNIIAFNCNIKLLAATGSLLGSYYYLELSGKQIAATRAFIMTTIFIASLIIGRRPYPLRSIALAAGIILLQRPEYIFHPSFQLSFIAVLSLVAGYQFYTKNKSLLGNSKGIFAAIKFYCASNIYSSFLASVVTAPVVINQFYIFSTYSIPMNLIAVPIMSFFLMPLSILSLCLAPLGTDQLVNQILKFFIRIIIDSAAFANSLPGSVWYFGYITPLSLSIFIFGYFWICLWQTKWRLFGLPIMFISIICMTVSPKPEMIISADASIIGVKNKDNKLEIYADKMSDFDRQYWANWYGQKDSQLLPLIASKFLTRNGKIIAINYIDSVCREADVQINISKHCPAKAIEIDKELLKKVSMIAIFCNAKECYIKYDDKSRFLSNK